MAYFLATNLIFLAVTVPIAVVSAIMGEGWEAARVLGGIWALYVFLCACAITARGGWREWK